MTPGFLLRVLGSFGLLCVLASIAAAPLLWLLQRHLSRFAPAAQARLLLALAALPFFAAAALHFAWTVYHHLIDPSTLTATHDCSIPVTRPMVLIGALVSARLAAAAVRAAAGSWRSYGAVRRLQSACDLTADGLHVSGSSEPQAFVLGFLRPRIFLSRGLLQAMDAPAVATIVAHEQAHVRRRDPLRRLLASLLLALHLPPLARRLEALLARAHEVAADAEAARIVGDRPGVAQTLVELARLRLAPAPAPAQSMAILGSDLEARVLDLLAPAERTEVPGTPMLLGAAALLTALAVVFAEPLHAAGEIFVRALG